MTTVAILDASHCGTTMLAGVVQALGVPMTLGGDRGFLEDAALADSLRSREAFETLVAERSGQAWGFKHNGAWRFARWFDCLENPMYFAIYKDPGTMARRFKREMDAHAVLDMVLRMKRSLCGVIASQLPVHVLSYLDAVRAPYLFAERVADLCGLGVTERQLHQASITVHLEGLDYG